MNSLENTSKILNGTLNKLTRNINKDLNYVNNDINTLQRNAILEIKSFKEVTDKQNQIIDNQISKRYNESNKVQDVKIQYEQLETDKIKAHNYLLIRIYYTFVLIFTIILFFKERLNNLYRNIAIILAFLLYPFLIFIIQYTIYNFIYTIYLNIIGIPLISNMYLNQQHDHENDHENE
jgi:cell division protein FtsX